MASLSHPVYQLLYFLNESITFHYHKIWIWFVGEILIIWLYNLVFGTSCLEDSGNDWIINLVW